MARNPFRIVPVPAVTARSGFFPERREAAGIAASGRFVPFRFRIAPERPKHLQVIDL